MSKMRKVLSGFLFVVAMLGLSVVTSDRAFAIDSKDVFTKVLVNNLETCYKNALVSNLPFSSYLSFDSLMNDGYKQSSDQNGFYIPAITDSYNKITQTASNTGGRIATCYALFMGDGTGLGTLSGSMTGLLEIYGKKNLVPTGITDRSAKLNNFMTNILKYSASTAQSSTTEYCYTVYVKENTTAAQPVKLGTACVNEDNYPLSMINKPVFTGSETTNYTLTSNVDFDEYNSPYFFLKLTVKSNNSKDMCTDDMSMVSCQATATVSASKPTTDTSTVNFSTAPGILYWHNKPSIYVQIEKKTGTGEGSSNTTYNKDNNKWRDVVQAITGQSYDSFAFSDADKYDFYLQYLKQNYGQGGAEIGSTQCVASKPASLVDEANQKYYIWIKNSGWCLANLASSKVNNKVKMTIFAGSSNRKLDKVIDTLPELINAMGALNYSDESNFVEVGQQGQPDGETNPGGNGGGNTDPGNNGGGEVGPLDGCFSNAGVLGWILCPVLKLAGAATNGIYDMIVENYLSVKSETMTSEALRGAWGTFQGYANVLFAILLVIVILSQVTGIGLSNYGIKKVLPKLIITIILVNLSYILCAIAVDLSNIVGTSLNDLLSGMDAGGLAASEINIGTMVLNSVEGIGLASLTLVAGGAAFPIVVEQWPNLILVLFLAVISILISILFFFILLVVRQAAIIILVVIAPLAVVCYALPNTQKLFDRWLKAFSALLMVFPICGAVMGGCNYASRLLLSAGGNNGLLYYIIVMVLGVVPLFFIPSILKSSMSALGSIGAKLATSGERFSRWANRAIVGSQAFQDRKQEAQRNVNMARNKRIMDHTKLSDAEQTRLDALRAKRASGAVLSNSERRELKDLGSRQYRYARAASARERGVMEDAMSDVVSRREMLEHGSARYEKIIAGAMREQRNKDDAGQIALYEDGKVDAFGGGGKVRGDSLDDLAKEHAALLAHVADNPDDEIAASKLRAVQTLLGKMGPNGFDKMEDNFGRLMANHSQFSSANSKGVGIATSHLSRNFASQIKANSRTFDKMLTDFNSDRFSQQSTFAQQSFTDAMGKAQTKYMSSYYGAQGAQSIKAENVNDLGDTYYDNLLRATINGDLQGKDLEQVLNVFNEAEAAAAAGKLTLKGEVKQRIQAIKNAAYANSALNGGARSEGSRMIGTAGAAGIDSIVKQIESAGDWSTMSNSEKQQYSDLVNNITDSLKQDAHTVEDVRQLQQALATARGKNIETAITGGTLISQVGTADLHSYKIPRGSKQKVTMPTGWVKNTSGTWVDIGTGRPLNNADAAKAEKILEHNASIDVENEV